MLGERRVDQGALFYDFSLERHVPADHMLRAIDRFVDFGEVRGRLAPFYSSTGRPSIDPELLIRMLIIGYCYGIRSERRLCQEVHLNLAYRWFCRLGLENDVPDHSTFSKNRHGRFRDSDLLRQVFETVVRRCMAEGLVGGDGFAVDASLIRAEASRQKGVEGSQGLAPEMSSRAIEDRPHRPRPSDTHPECAGRAQSVAHLEHADREGRCKPARARQGDHRTWLDCGLERRHQSQRHQHD